MLTQEQVLEAVRGGREPVCLDGRDYSRLCDFFPIEDWKCFGFAVGDGAAEAPPKPWTEEAVRGQLAKDVALGFERALDRRGVSAGLMYLVVKMWLWVLEDPLERDGRYACYGLPLFKAVAVKYGLPNPIGSDAGHEKKYGSAVL